MKYLMSLYIVMAIMVVVNLTSEFVFKCDYSAYFGFHDETRSYDLQNSRFVEDEEKWV